MKKTGIIVDHRFMEHDTGPFHPESPQRLEVIYNSLEEEKEPYVFLPGLPAAREDLERVHTEDYINLLESLKGKSSSLDADTPISPPSVEIAQLAVGGCINLVRHIHEHHIDNGFALVRPPGHHAEPDRGMGFCLYNNIALAARYLIVMLKYERILIVDFDLHHGNGTQKAFYEDERVLYFSTHQYPYYPGSGHWSEIGKGRGEGFNINIPLAGGQKDADYLFIFKNILEPVALEYKPQFILISAGYDTYHLDPLGGMKVTEEGFGLMTLFLKNLAGRCSDGKLAFFLEGGYHLEGLRNSVLETLKDLREEEGKFQLPSLDDILEDTEASVEKAIICHKDKWKSLSEE